jgi:hypothetical protein
MGEQGHHVGATLNETRDVGNVLHRGTIKEC